MDVELRWFKYARGHNPVLQVRYREGPLGEDWWGEWQKVEMVFEKDGYSDT